MNWFHRVTGAIEFDQQTGERGTRIVYRKAAHQVELTRRLEEDIGARAENPPPPLTDDEVVAITIWCDAVGRLSVSGGLSRDALSRALIESVTWFAAQLTSDVRRSKGLVDGQSAEDCLLLLMSMESAFENPVAEPILRTIGGFAPDIDDQLRSMRREIARGSGDRVQNISKSEAGQILFSEASPTAFHTDSSGLLNLSRLFFRDRADRAHMKPIAQRAAGHEERIREIAFEAGVSNAIDHVEAIEQLQELVGRLPADDRVIIDCAVEEGIGAESWGSTEHYEAMVARGYRKSDRTLRRDAQRILADLIASARSA